MMMMMLLLSPICRA